MESFRIFELRKSTRINPKDGEPSTYFLMRGLNWANVIALTEKNDVLLIRQYRHGIDDYTIEIPGGCVEKDDCDPGLSAKRELEEETGYSSDEFTHLGTVQANPAMHSMLAYTYLARNIKKIGEQHLDAGEDIEVLFKPLDEVLKLIKDGEIKHAIIVAAFGHLLLKRNELRL